MGRVIARQALHEQSQTPRDTLFRSFTMKSTSLGTLCFLIIAVPYAIASRISLAAELAEVAAAPAAGTLAAVIINRQNIFDENAQPAYQLINKFHRVTRESVIAREVWLQQGDPVTAADAEELERNLRDLDLFAWVQVSLREDINQPGQTDLIINTTDRLSIVASVGGSFLGGVGEVNFSVGDNNLLGLGHQLILGYSENSEGELLGSVAYDNVLIGANDIYAGIGVGQTEEGDFAAATITNRFLNFDDRRFWRIELESESTRDDIFESGESVAEVPRSDEQLKLQWQHRAGIPARFFRSGPVLDLQRTRYEAPIGLQAESVEQPEDTTSIFAGGFIAMDSNRAFKRVTGLDTLRFVQDLTLGYSAQLLAGLTRLTTDVRDDTLPTLSVLGRSTNAVSPDTYLNAAVNASANIDGSSLSKWSVSAASTLFNTQLPRQTLAARIKYDTAFDRDGVPPQQTLGEARGLRGYPSREFNGEQKLLLNLEHRWHTPFTMATLEFGTVTFFDAGWVGDRGSSEWLDNARTAAGTGLRIGSRQLLGSLIIRIDLAFPLGAEASMFDPSVSLAVGQVFGFRP